jgi:catechol 2,3-dioxygenase-like lactoylglutathione lyase family enzyme
MSASRVQPTLCQVALVTLDVARSVRFYGELLGVRHAGYIPVQGRIAARMFGVPRVQGTCHWLAGEASFFQLELFHFDDPVSQSRPRRHDDLGFQRIAVEVADLPAARRSVAALGGELLTDIHHGASADHAWVRDPDGVLIELIQPPHAVAQPRLLGISAVVEDLTDARRALADCLGLGQWAAGAAEREPGGQDAPCPPADESAALAAGPYWIELNRYGDGRAAHRPHLTDRGLMNIALGVRRPSEFKDLYRSLLEQGRRCATDPVGSLFGHTVYTEPTSSLSVELLQLPAFLDPLWGFRPPGLIAAAVQRVLRFMLRRQPQPVTA